MAQGGPNASGNAVHQPAAPSAGSLTRFFSDVLRGLGAPVTRANLTAFLAWHQAEGGSASYNPLNTTLMMPGAGSYNSVGVRNYRNYGQGVQATINTLRGGYYAQILNALHAGTNPYAVATGISNSPWGTSGSLVTQILHGWGAGGAPASAYGQGVSGRGGIGALGSAGHGLARITGGALAAGNAAAAASLLASIRPIQIKPVSLSLPTAQDTLAKLYPMPQQVAQPFPAPPPIRSASGLTNPELTSQLATQRQRLLGIV